MAERGLAKLDAVVNKTMMKVVEHFDITGEGTILGANSGAPPPPPPPPPSKSAPSTPSGAHDMSTDEHAARRAKTHGGSHRPNKKQQLKHAMTVQSAHMITMDYMALSQPLSDGMLLNDRTDHKLKLIHSLGELQPMHTYTTESGNVLERPSKHKAVLAGSIELEILTDEADFDEAMGRLALGGAEASSSLTQGMRVAAYDAFSRQQHPGSNGHTADGGGGAACHHAAASLPTSYHGAAPSMENGAGAAHACDDDPRRGERLREAEALERIGSLVARLGEMEEWFAGVKAEAERERCMREQASARLSVMHERVELLSTQLAELQAENTLLRQRVADVTAVYEDEFDGGNGEGDGSLHNGNGAHIRPPGVR